MDHFKEDELNQVIKNMKPVESPGSDGIFPETIKS